MENVVSNVIIKVLLGIGRKQNFIKIMLCISGRTLSNQDNFYSL